MDSATSTLLVSSSLIVFSGGLSDLIRIIREREFATEQFLVLRFQSRESTFNFIATARDHFVLFLAKSQTLYRISEQSLVLEYMSSQRRDIVHRKGRRRRRIDGIQLDQQAAKALILFREGPLL